VLNYESLKDNPGKVIALLKEDISLKQKENRDLISLGMDKTHYIQRLVKKTKLFHEKSERAHADTLEMWRDLSTYEADFICSHDHTL
jgi:hypothetical protein